MDLTTSLGLVAGTLTTLAYFPQVVKTWRAKSADGMSWSMLVILWVGISLWLVYGLYAHDAPVIAANVVTLLLASLILAMKVRYEAVPRLQTRNAVWVTPEQGVLHPSVQSDFAASLPDRSDREPVATQDDAEKTLTLV